MNVCTPTGKIYKHAVTITQLGDRYVLHNTHVKERISEKGSPGLKG